MVLLGLQRGDAGLNEQIMGQYFVNGLCWGSHYAVIALGFAVALNAGRALHLAHGAVFALAGLTAYHTHRTWEWPLPMSVASAIITGGVVSVLIDRVVYAPIRIRRVGQAATNAVIVGALGADAALRGLMALAWGSEAKVMAMGTGMSLHLHDATISLSQLWQLLAFVLIAVAATAVLGTPLGRASRALVDDPDLLGVLGYNVRAMRVGAMAVAGVLAGCAGFLAVADAGIDARSGLDAVLIAAAITCLSGSRWISGPLFGAQLLGQVQAWAGSLVPSKWSPVLVYAILMAVLLLRPRGLLSASSRPDAV